MTEANIYDQMAQEHRANQKLIETLQKEVDRLNKAVESEKSKLRKINVEAAAVKHSDELKAQVEQLAKDLKVAQADAVNAERVARELYTKRVAQLEKSLASARDALHEAHQNSSSLLAQEKANTSTQIANLRAEVARLSSELTTANTRSVSEVAVASDSLRRQVDGLQKQLRDAQESRVRAIDEAASVRNSARTNSDALVKIKGELEQQLTDTKRQLEMRTRELAAARGSIDDANRKVDAVRADQGPYIERLKQNWTEEHATRLAAERTTNDLRRLNTDQAIRIRAAETDLKAAQARADAARVTVSTDADQRVNQLRKEIDRMQRERLGEAKTRAEEKAAIDKQIAQERQERDNLRKELAKANFDKQNAESKLEAIERQRVGT